MNIIEHSSPRLVVTVRQKSFVFLAGGFFVFGFAMAIAGLAGGETPLGWSVGFALAGALSSLLMLGIEKHVRITFDADAAELFAVSRQFRREKTFRADLSQVAGVTIESRQQGPKTRYALRFIGTDGAPLEFIHYIDPGPKVELPLLTMDEWLAAYNKRQGSAD